MNKCISLSQHIILFFILAITSKLSLAASALSEQSKAPVIDEIVKKKSSSAVTFKARVDEDFLLSADYYYVDNTANKERDKKTSKEKSGGVIVLHDCHSDRSRYSELAQTIAAQGLHVLSLDFRGYGDSIAAGFSQLEIKRNSKDIVSYQNDIALITSYWAEDLTAAYQFLLTKIDKSQGIAVVASGCAAGYAVSLAEKIHLKGMVFITPIMTYGDKERYKNLIDFPNYFITSAHHSESFNTSQELFAWNGSTHSKIQTFNGNSRERQLLSTNVNLVNDIAKWLKFNLR